MRNMVLPEIAAREAQEWNTDAALPDIWEVMHECEEADLDIYNTETIVDWSIFLKKNNVATLKEFLQRFTEGRKKKDFYEFSKYCSTLYRQVHKKQLTEDISDVKRAFIQERMAGAIKMDQLGDQYHEDRENDYWQRRASIVGPEDRELPRAHVRLRGSYNSFEEFMEAHKKFDGYRDNTSPMENDLRQNVINKRRKGTAKNIRTTLER